MSSTQSLPIIFAQALRNASKAATGSAIELKTQELVRSAQRDLTSVANRANALSLFSENETLEDISTGDLVYLFVPYVDAELHDRTYRPDPLERLMGLRQIQTSLKTFTDKLVAYEIVPTSDRELYDKAPNDPSRRREVKLKQWKQEKELQTQVEGLQTRRGQKSASIDGSSSDMELIASLLRTNKPAQSMPAPDPEDEEDDMEISDLLRKTTLLLLRLTYTRACSRLESLEQETSLLQSMASRPAPQNTEDSRSTVRAAQDDQWRLDRPLPSGGPDGKGPLMDASGKPLRPFTILPGGASADRARLQGQVFRPDHRLPTMSIDEYLAIEEERGNIISGGGKASEEAPTSSEQLAMDAEQDGTAFGDEKEDEQREKNEKWARYTDANPKGAGNTINRG